MDTSWITAIVPTRLAKASQQLARDKARQDHEIEETIEEQLFRAFEIHEFPPSGFLSGIRARFAASAMLRNLPSFSQHNDERAAQWIKVFDLRGQEPILFNLIFTRAHNTFIQEGNSSSIGPLANQVFSGKVHEILVGDKSIDKDIVSALLGPALPFEKCAEVIARKSRNLDELCRVAPFDQSSPPFSSLVFLFLIIGNQRELRQFLFGTSREVLSNVLGQRVDKALADMPLRIFSEIVNIALESHIKGDGVWTQGGRFSPELRAIIDQRLLEPVRNSARWRFVKPDLTLAYQTIIKREAVDAFFDSRTDYDRREFWRKYASSMESVPLTMGESDQVFLMIFGAMGVIETKEAGKGAAYFYSRDNIDKIFLKPENRRRWHNFYKMGAPCLNIQRLSHWQGWQPRFEAYLRNSHGIVPDRVR